MDTKFKNFNETFFKGTKKKIDWFDIDGVLKLDDTRVVKFKLDTHGVRDQYEGYLIQIINKHDGIVDRKFFSFKEYLEFSHRPDSKHYHVWKYGGNLDWYISRPIKTKPMVDRIFDWVGQFE